MEHRGVRLFVAARALTCLRLYAPEYDQTLLKKLLEFVWFALRFHMLFYRSFEKLYWPLASDPLL